MFPCRKIQTNYAEHFRIDGLPFRAIRLIFLRVPGHKAAADRVVVSGAVVIEAEIWIVLFPAVEVIVWSCACGPRIPDEFQVSEVRLWPPSRDSQTKVRHIELRVFTTADLRDPHIDNSPATHPESPDAFKIADYYLALTMSE